MVGWVCHAYIILSPNTLAQIVSWSLGVYWSIRIVIWGVRLLWIVPDSIRIPTKQTSYNIITAILMTICIWTTSLTIPIDPALSRQ